MFNLVSVVQDIIRREESLYNLIEGTLVSLLIGDDVMEVHVSDHGQLAEGGILVPMASPNEVLENLDPPWNLYRIQVVG